MSESQKDTFRKYLEQAGAIDVLVKGEWTDTCAQSGLLSHNMMDRKFYHFAASIAETLTSGFFEHAVLVQLYEEPSKPKQALE